MVKLIIHQFPKDHNCISILCGALSLACWGTGVLSSVEGTSTDVCVGARERGNSGDCQGWLGWLHGWGQRFGYFVALKSIGMSRFAAIRRKGYVEGTTTAVFHRSKISVVSLGEKFSGTRGFAEGNTASLTGRFYLFPTKNSSSTCFCFWLLLCLSWGATDKELAASILSSQQLVMGLL